MIIYELWEMVSMGDGEPLQPFILERRSKSYENIYAAFLETIKTKPCAIFITNEEKDRTTAEAGS